MEKIDPPDLERHESIDAEHGRIETSIIAVRSLLPARLDTQWKGLVQIMRIERRRELKALCQRQVIYAITSLPRQTHGAAELLTLARQHCHVENRLFHVRDATFREDGCRVRTGNAPQALAHCRDKVMAVIRKHGWQIRPAREAFAANPKAAIRLIMKS